MLMDEIGEEFCEETGYIERLCWCERCVKKQETGLYSNPPNK